MTSLEWLWHSGNSSLPNAKKNHTRETEIQLVITPINHFNIIQTVIRGTEIKVGGTQDAFRWGGRVDGKERRMPGSLLIYPVNANISLIPQVTKTFLQFREQFTSSSKQEQRNAKAIHPECIIPSLLHYALHTPDIYYSKGGASTIFMIFSLVPAKPIIYQKSSRTETHPVVPTLLWKIIELLVYGMSS